MCDLSSLDIWAEVKATCPELNISVNFEIKIIRSLPYKDFKLIIHSYITSMATSKKSTFDGPTYLIFKRRSIYRNSLNLAESCSSIYTYTDIEPTPSDPIGEIFDYNSRPIYYELELQDGEASPITVDATESEHVSEGFLSEISARYQYRYSGLLIRELNISHTDVELTRLSQISGTQRSEGDRFYGGMCCSSFRCIII
jgi:hypothetical protein